MRRPFEAWRRNLVLWGVPLAFCLVNLLVLGFFFSFYAGEVERLEKRNQDIERELAVLGQQSEQIEDVLGRIETQRQSIQRLYGERFSTEAERFTEVITEVKRLARDAGLNPTAFSYPQRPLEGEGLVQRDIEFSVEGTYQQLRTFINFLELTEQFVTLNGVSLSEGGANRLSIRVQLSTVFATDPEGPATGAARGEST